MAAHFDCNRDTVEGRLNWARRRRQGAPSIQKVTGTRDTLAINKIRPCHKNEPQAVYAFQVLEFVDVFQQHNGTSISRPELTIRMLIVGYCFGIRSERRPCEGVHLNLAYLLSAWARRLRA